MSTQGKALIPEKNFTMANLLNQLDDAFADVTAKTCTGLTKKGREVEDRFWKEDAVLYG